MGMRAEVGGEGSLANSNIIGPILTNVLFKSLHKHSVIYKTDDCQ